MSSPSIPGYERLSQIGKGGFSRVYAGEQAKLKRLVAIKVLNFGLSDEEDRRSFERECELMGRVSTHPNIVTVHDTAFTASGQPCIVMEHYPGGSIADLLREVGRLQTKEALEVGVAMAGALEASHQAGVLHCDLKPQNILVSEFGQPALGDFGISTFSEERTRTGSEGGVGFTLAYAAPEIVEGASPSVQSDLYSLAATLYTTLAGRRPFFYLDATGEKPTAAEQARRILIEEPSSLVDDGVPPELDAVIRQAMAKEPAQRPASAADFARSLFEIGRRLGYGTSAPRIADQGALSVPGVVAGPVAAEWDPAKQQESLDLTELRRAEATALRVDMPRPQHQPEPVVSNRRRLLAPIIGLVSLLVVGAVVYFVSQGDPASQPAAAVPTAIPEDAVAPALPPPAPRNAEVIRVGEDSILISWSNEPQDDIMYEVVFDTAGSEPVAISATSPIVLDGVGPQDVPCVGLTAERKNLLSPAPGRRCVSPRLTAYAELAPAECQLPCTAGLALQGFDPGVELAVSIAQVGSGSSAINDSATGVSVSEFERIIVTDENGAAGDWQVTFDQDALDEAQVAERSFVVTLEDASAGLEYHSLLTVSRSQ